jgi:PAS domain S-box-containing protein
MSIETLAGSSDLIAALARPDYQKILDALPAAIYATDANGIITFFNRAAVEMAGRTPLVGIDKWCVTHRLYRPDGSLLPHDQCPMAIALREARPVRNVEIIVERPDGRRAPAMPYPTPIFDEDGELSGAVNLIVDITERKKAEAERELLLAELSHRVKNTLATVISVAHQSFAGEPGFKEARMRFESRLHALAQTHTRLAETNWSTVDLATLLHDELLPYGSGDTVRIEGPEVALQSRQAIMLGMGFHELATNAGKYGALSVVGGHISVDWDIVDHGSTLEIVWTESGGPAVAAPSRRGFGRVLLERALTAELRGEVAMEFPSAGLCCTIRVPLRPDRT